VSRFARGSCGAVVTNLYLVAVGPAVAFLVPCGFGVVPVGGAGVSAVGCNDGRDDGRHNSYGGGHSGECLLYVLNCLGECSIGGNEALDGGIFLNGCIGKVVQQRCQTLNVT
jgi:hypothetical protein